MKNAQFMLSPLLCLSTVLYPVATFAGASGDAIDKFHKTCDYALYSQKEGDMTLGSCKQAEIAEGVHKNQKAAAVVYGAMTAVAAAMIPIENTPPPSPGIAIAKGVCLGLAAGGVVKNFVDAGKLKKAGAEVVGGYATAVNSFVKAGTGMVVGKAVTGVLFNGNSLSQAINTVNTTSGSTEIGCIITAAGLGVMMSGAISASGSARKAMEAATATASSQIQGSQKSVSYNLQGPKGAGKPNNNVSAPNNSPASEFSCESQSGNAFAKCLGKTNPEIAALMSNPRAMDAMDRALGGKNLGDFAKNFKGDSEQDLANYVANGMGMSSSGFSGLIDSNKKFAQQLGLQEAYKPGTFASVNNGANGHKGGVDPMEKMLADMMKQMGDMGEDGLGKDRDPASEISFANQMELLRPEQIEARKDISLFDRAHYRMQKNAKNLEQLNWSTRDQ